MTNSALSDPCRVSKVKLFESSPPRNKRDYVVKVFYGMEKFGIVMLAMVMLTIERAN